MILKSAEETIEYGNSFAKKLKGGEVLALTGDLGSGKTTFIKGLAEGLKVASNITSPTFVILKEYAFRHAILRPKDNLRGCRYMVRKFVHIDAYRVESIEDIKSVGIEDYLGRKDVVMAIEWAEKILEILPKNTININFKHLNENTREIKIK